MRQFAIADWRISIAAAAILIASGRPWPPGYSLAADAQPAGRTVTIGYLGNSSPALESNLVDAFREGLRQLGYVEGRNLILKFEWAEGQQERHPALARALVRLTPDVILTAGTPGTLAAKRATQSIPIVTAISWGRGGDRPRGEPREAGWQCDRAVHACAGAWTGSDSSSERGGPEAVAGCGPSKSGQPVHDDRLEGHAAGGGGAGPEAPAGGRVEPGRPGSRPRQDHGCAPRRARPYRRIASWPRIGCRLSNLWSRIGSLGCSRIRNSPRRAAS